MKRIAMIITAALLTVVMAVGCANSTEKDKTKNPDTSNENEVEGEVKQEEEDSSVSEVKDSFKIGVIQFVEHTALDASYEGFKEGLREAGYEEGKNISIDYQNAQGDQSNCVTIAEKFVNDKVDLILAIATPAAQAAAGKTSDIPILVTAVTDPHSSGLVDSNEMPGGNVSGSSDLTPVATQMELLDKLFPESKNVGVLFCSSEDNSEFQADLAIAKLEEIGKTGEKYTISTLDEIQAVVESMKGKVDVIYTPTDNKIAEGMTTVTMIATEAGIACIVGEPGMVTNGGLATIGLSYVNLGKLTGEQAAKILSGQEDIKTMPIAYLAEEDCEFSYNEEVAKSLGIEIDASQFE